MRCSPGCRCRRHQASGRPIGSGLPLLDRFWPHVERRGYDECWPWTGATARSRGGLLYGKFGVRAGELGLAGRADGKPPSTQAAHRVAFHLVHGRWPVPQGLHGCDFPLCCNAENPEHVHEGTAAQNTAEMFLRGRGCLPPVQVGADAHRAKLTDEQALEIIARYRAGGVSQAALGAEYGVAQYSISYIVRGKRRSLQ